MANIRPVHGQKWTKQKKVRVDFLIENWSKIANIGRIWTKLSRNPIELDVPELLGGLPGPNLDQDGPKKCKNRNKYTKQKSCVRGSSLYIFIYYTIYTLPYICIYIYIYWYMDGLYMACRTVAIGHYNTQPE